VSSERAGLPYPDGDPGGLESSAGRLSSLAAVVAGDAADAAAAARPDSWVGPAAGAFAMVAVDLANRLATSAHRLRAAAVPVRTLAHTLDHAQRQVTRWAREIEAAEHTASRAQDGVTNARSAAAPFLTGGNPLAAPALDPRVLAAQQVAMRAQQHVDELRKRYHSKAQALCDDVADDDRAAGVALVAAADAAPAGGNGVPGNPGVPADVRLFSPVFLFHPDEKYLPTDADRDLRGGIPMPHGPRGYYPTVLPIAAGYNKKDVRKLAGEGAGAPIYYNVRTDPKTGEKVIEYWVYRKFNDFRNKHLEGPLKGVHRGDWEAVAVKLDRHGKPQQVAFSQHSGGCAEPYDDVTKRRGHPTAYSALGSAANYPKPGAYKNHPPYEDLASGQGTGRRIVRSGENLVDYDGTQAADFDGHWGDDRSPQGPQHQQKKFAPQSATWTKPCDEPLKAGG
jgi:outer membrane murein-binding lipoprotein Lpp